MKNAFVLCLCCADFLRPRIYFFFSSLPSILTKISQRVQFIFHFFGLSFCFCLRISKSTHQQTMFFQFVFSQIFCFFARFAILFVFYLSSSPPSSSKLSKTKEKLILCVFSVFVVLEQRLVLFCFPQTTKMVFHGFFTQVLGPFLDTTS